MAELKPEQVDRWQAVLENQTGINLAQHKHILRNGLIPWLGSMSTNEVEMMLARAENQPWPGVGGWLVDHLAVKETRFYRTPAAYRVLAQYLQKRTLWAEQRNCALTVDLWSAGCSTGEEAYTMAMVAADLLARSTTKSYFGVIGSDISSAAISLARKAVYHSRRLQELPEALKERYMQADEGRGFQVAPSLQSRVCFVQSNLLDPDSTPRSKMDVIFCQNVLVYFRGSRQNQVLDNLVTRMKPEGILVIGASEGRGWQNPRVKRLAGEDVQVFQRRREKEN